MTTNFEVGFGTVGYGMIARTHLAAMSAMAALRPDEPHAVPRALCTRSPQACAALPYGAVYDDWQALLADEQVQVVDICTPNHLHGEVAVAALKGGKSVYLEKPITHTWGSARALADLAGRTGLPNQAALVFRFCPAVARMKDRLDAGEIGEVIHFRACFYHGSYLDPARPTSWRQQLAKCGGGAVMDLGIHVLDLVRYLLGEAESLTAAAKTVNKSRYTDNTRTATVPNDTDEYLCATLRMENGALGMVESSRVSSSALGNEFLEVFGTRGSLYLDLDGEGGLWLAPADGTGPRRLTGTAPGPVEQELAALLPPARQSLGPFVDAHAAAIQNMCRWHTGGAPFSGTPTFRQAALSQALVHACLQAAETGQHTVPPTL